MRERERERERERDEYSIKINSFAEKNILKNQLQWYNDGVLINKMHYNGVFV